MTKKEMHDALKADGAKIKAVNFYSLEQLEKLYAERFGDESVSGNDVPDGKDIVVPAKAESEIHTLVFDHSGWCEELNGSYFQGLYRPSSLAEYSVLRKYAQKEI